MITVIIPIYKVGEYLDDCILSVVNQSYTDLEIILVDDGSPDLCPQICDEWAKKDTRVKVIHKVNGGLSDARNVGIDNATGDYISFLDSDDYMSKDCIEKLYQALLKYPDCSISSCSHWLDKDGIIEPTFNKNWEFNSIRFVEPEEYADKMLLMESQHTAWGKLYKKEVLQNIRFRKGYNNEDILFCLDFYPLVEKNHIRIVEIPDKLIYYRQREGSICHSKDNSFSVSVTKNSIMVFKSTKGVKPKVYEYYRKQSIHAVVQLISFILNYPDTYPSSFFSMSILLWNFPDKYAKQELNNSEYATFIHSKYFPFLMLLKYKIKRLTNRGK